MELCRNFLKEDEIRNLHDVKEDHLESAGAIRVPMTMSKVDFHLTRTILQLLEISISLEEFLIRTLVNTRETL